MDLGHPQDIGALLKIIIKPEDATILFYETLFHKGL
jgi:hypothetical protein